MPPRISSVEPPDISKKERTPKFRKLEEELGRFYFGIGMVLQPAGLVYPPLAGVGSGCITHHEEAAKAWTDLAEKNPKIAAMLESIVSASAMGAVIGIHLTILAGGFAGFRFGAMPTSPEGDNGDNPFAQSGMMYGMGGNPEQQPEWNDKGFASSE